MTTSLRAVALQTVANYRHAAERTLGATHSGGQRLIGVLRERVDRSAQPRAPALAAVLRRAADHLGRFADQGLATVSGRTSRVIAVGADGVQDQVRRIAGLAEGVDNRLVAGSLRLAARASLPGARVALALSERVASGADKLAEVAGAAQARRAARGIGKRVRRAKAEATDAAAPVQAQAGPVKRRTRPAAAPATQNAGKADKADQALKGKKTAPAGKAAKAGAPTRTARKPRSTEAASS